MENPAASHGDRNAGVQRAKMKGNADRAALRDLKQFPPQGRKVETQLKSLTLNEQVQQIQKSEESIADGNVVCKDHGARRSWSSGNTEDFLSFEPTERPKWREATISGESDSIPSVSQMVKDIVEYEKTYEALKTSDNRSARRRVLRCLHVKFLYNVQKEENIGVREEGKTREIMDELDSEINVYRTKRKLSDSFHDINPVKKQLLNESPEFESYPSLEEQIEDIHGGITSSEHDLKPPKSKTETKNLYKAYNHIVEELNKSKSDTSISSQNEMFTGNLATEDCKGVIDLDALIIDTHRILMEDVMKADQMSGRFSINERKANFRGTEYRYPWFEDENVADHAVQTLVDKVNDIMEDIKHRTVSEEERIKLYFKCSSLFLFGFLTLHPFPDGNGRLARLLASYHLSMFSPFMTPIYNVFSSSRECDYVQALVDARINLQFPPKISVKEDAVKLTISIMHEKPKDLCAMLIESNWTMWRQLLVQLGDDRIQLFEWELQNQQCLEKTFEVALLV